MYACANVPKMVGFCSAAFCLLLSPVAPDVIELSVVWSTEWTGLFVSLPLSYFQEL